MIFGTATLEVSRNVAPATPSPTATFDPVASIGKAADGIFNGFGTIVLLFSALGLIAVTALNLYGGSLTAISALDSFRRVRPTLGVRVLHRVIRVDGDRLVLKGDANDFVDDARPRSTDVVGSYWFAVPRAGAALSWMQAPPHAALLAFLLTLVAFSGGAVVRPAAKGKLSSR